MINKLKIIQSNDVDPYINIALEEELLNSVSKGECILYLWQNKNTVVIGRNQNAWVECRTELLSKEGGNLARRLSGGGAVYHDLGNLNFTFLMPQEEYDLEKQLRVIQLAISNFGIPVEFSGRNDLLADGRKFSGNAFYHCGGKSYHHGTILVDVDSEKLSRYLSPSDAKLKAKGVSSVRSRVVNLKELKPDITINAIIDHLVDAFSAIYKLPIETAILSDTQKANIQKRSVFFRSWDWLYGAPLPFSFSCEDRFPWGSFQLLLQVNKGRINDAKVYTDAMQWELGHEIEILLQNTNFITEEITTAIQKAKALPDEIINDICNLIKSQNI